MNKTNSKKKILVICLWIFIIICLIAVISKIIYSYNHSTWITYKFIDKKENLKTTEVYNIYVSRNGEITGMHSESFLTEQLGKKLIKEELRELKELVKKFQNNTKGNEKDSNYKNGITIDNNNYYYSDLNVEQHKIYRKIEEIIR